MGCGIERVLHRETIMADIDNRSHRSGFLGVVLALVVLALLAYGAYWFYNNTPNSQQHGVVAGKVTQLEKTVTSHAGTLKNLDGRVTAIEDAHKPKPAPKESEAVKAEKQRLAEAKKAAKKAEAEAKDAATIATIRRDIAMAQAETARAQAQAQAALCCQPQVVLPPLPTSCCVQQPIVVAPLAPLPYDPCAPAGCNVSPPGSAPTRGLAPAGEQQTLADFLAGVKAAAPAGQQFLGVNNGDLGKINCTDKGGRLVVSNRILPIPPNAPPGTRQTRALDCVFN